MLKPGIYEQVINKQINSELSSLLDARKFFGPIDKAESSKILANYLSEILHKGLDRVLDNGGDISSQISLVNQIIDLIRNITKEADVDSLSIDQRAKLLLALLRENDPRLLLGKTASDMNRPETSVAQSSLFTGAIHEPQLFSELKKEISSSDQIDLLVSFIKWSGLRLIIDELREFTQNGGRLRIITTSYMGATDIKSIEELAKLSNTEVKISYDTKRTRLHAKTYVFYRDTGFTTAYVGSSNLSNVAISSGLEWNVKVTAKDLSSTIQKITATFESYWNSSEFEFYKESEHERLILALKAEKNLGYDGSRVFFLDIHPYPFQQEILDNLNAERIVRGLYRNLVVSATGTGKTVISAFDYRRFCKENSGTLNRLLFVAHREEILKQSIDTFKGVLKDPNFGELFVGRFNPGSLDHLFVSIQTINSQAFYEKLPEDFYDYIIVDEFHHAAAPTYMKLLNHFKPKILLGLTATPERMDGKSILDFFDDRIAAEIRLPGAIDRKLLAPFQYFGVSDTIDLSELRWTRGSYDKSQLSNLYSFNRAVAERRADHIIQSLEKYVTDIGELKALGFCVSIEHAIFMAEHFNKRGIPSMSLTGQSPDEERNTAKKRLVFGEIRVIFVVDIYNEGVDIPEVNTVLFLRPTESLTIFLQQLGRGLRLSEGKECLTVFDFIGQANKKYNFEEKFAALLSNTRHSVQYELKNGFVSVPKGCYIQLEKKATEVILENIKNSFGKKGGLQSRIKTFEEDSGLPLTLANFVNFYRLDLRTIYSNNSFARLCVLAGVKVSFTEPAETLLTKSLRRVAAIDSRRWITFLLRILSSLEKVDFSELSPLERRMLQMFHYSVWGEVIVDWNSDKIVREKRTLINSPVMLAELIDVLKYKFDHIDFIDESVDLGFDCPLDLHCSYTRDQILLALDYMAPSNVREGVKWLPDKKLDVFFITLNKSNKDYSPTTMYNDYSINEELFHWQSQSTTPDTAPTGQRYINHRRMGSKILLFVREFKNDKTGTAPYTYLGSANYVKHEGSKPMNITWKLDRPIPAKFLKKTNKLVVG
jgi:superfamily II DNA or RNA helicase